MSKDFNEQEVAAAVRAVIAAARKAFIEPDKATDAECLGIAVAHYFEWDGTDILTTAAEALEDANFHREAEAVLALAFDDDGAPVGPVALPSVGSVELPSVSVMEGLRLV